MAEIMQQSAGKKQTRIITLNVAFHFVFLEVVFKAATYKSALLLATNDSNLLPSSGNNM